MTWVKVCGMTSREAVEAAVGAGADAIGLVLWEGSPRALTLDRARDLARGVEIDSFIVSVDLNPGEALAAVESVGATGIQAHGERSLDVAAEAAEAGYLTIAPIPVGVDGPLVDVDEVPEASMLLFDTASAQSPSAQSPSAQSPSAQSPSAQSHWRTPAHGGTGTPFDWRLVSDPGRPFILAGGLGPHNVAEAIAALHPFGVDASSSLESELGIKDPSKIVAFIEEAKRR